MPVANRRVAEVEPSLRPRELLFRAGAEALTDAQLVALFLGSGDRRENVIALAGRLLEECGGVRGLLSSEPEVLLAKRGLGAARVATLKAALELTGRYLAERLERCTVMSDPAATKRYLQVRLDAADREVFACLFLDAQHRVLGFEELFFGTVDGAPVYPREVIKAALKHNAAALIVAHNHPSGMAEPSAADVALTARLKSACEVVDIRLIDHVVIGRPDAVSLAERGLI
ncbi:MAG: JAB domain-containing protein [Candidatus Dadabacteria bacterium]|nr:MAG: JAB domain-containing protein [Candidatus Dadabacteria bacterium]